MDHKDCKHCGKPMDWVDIREPEPLSFWKCFVCNLIAWDSPVDRGLPGKEITFSCCARCDFKSRWETDLLEGLCPSCAEQRKKVEKALDKAYERRDW